MTASRSNRLLAWLSFALAAGAPPLAMVLFGQAASPFPLAGGPLLAVGLMGAGMIAAAITGRLWIGVALALLDGVVLVLLARAAGMVLPAFPLATGLACVIASLSFAARGALFARSGGVRGWVIALAVVAGEAAMLLTALASPGALPRWLLVLLPAQWASTAIQTALAGGGAVAAIAPLLALGGTAATTLLVARLWPRRWPYAVMFSAWLGFSALVWHWPASSTPVAEPSTEPAAVLQKTR